MGKPSLARRPNATMLGGARWLKPPKAGDWKTIPTQAFQRCESDLDCKARSMTPLWIDSCLSRLVAPVITPPWRLGLKTNLPEPNSNGDCTFEATCAKRETAASPR